MKTLLRKSGIFAIALLFANLFFINDTNAQAITQLTAWTKFYDNISGTATGSNFAITAGSNRILIVAISNAYPDQGSTTVNDPTTITYGGVTLTKATGNGGRRHICIPGCII